MTRRQKRTNLIALLVGLCATAAVIAAYLAGGLERFEQIAYDLRIRNVNPIDESPDIVCFDVDNGSIERVGRWPWSRDQQSALIDVLAELGAKLILVDLTWSESEPLRVALRPDFDIVADPLAARLDDVVLTYPDATLSGAIRQAGNVYLSFDYVGNVSLFGEEVEQAIDALERRDEAAALRLCESISTRAREQARLQPRIAGEVEWANRVLHFVRLIAAIEADPAGAAAASSSSAALASKVGPDEFEKCRAVALRRIVRRWLDESPEHAQLAPQRVFDGVYRKLTGSGNAGESTLRTALALAIRHVLGERATLQPWLPAPDAVAGATVRIEELTPVYFQHAAAARRSGFVNFEPDADGIVRHVPLLGVCRGRVVAQIALAVACDYLGVGADGIVARPGELVLRSADPAISERRIPIDARGRALVPWSPHTPWTTNFEHRPASVLVELRDKRRKIAENEERIREVLADALKHPSITSGAEDAKLLADWADAEREIASARLIGDETVVEVLTAQLSELAPALAAIETRVLELASAQPAPATRTTAPDERPSLGEYAAVILRARDANAQMQASIDDDLRQLRPIVAGRLCLVGYAATSLADLKPTPTSESAPGVLAHANLLNGIITNQLVSQTSVATNTTLAAVLGAILSIAAVLMRPRLSVLVMLFFVVAFTAIAGVFCFQRSLLAVGFVPTLAAMLASYAAVSIYRYIFIEGERRQLSTALGQYTSKEIARQVAENADLCRRAEMREVTAVFTDLRGFTTISEKIGAERTQKVLNICLGRFTDVLLRHEAMVNKFIGDGIFAFWNPVIYPQADHAIRACESAADLIASVVALRDEQRRRGGDETFGELMLRVGVATGNAIVGPCGSEQKFDYTCIGDSVNVAARLESANKFYGTQILVSGATREQVGERFAFRALGGVQVKGKKFAVQVYELLGRSGQVADAALEYADAFGRAIERFQQRDFETARGAFATLHQRRPDDLAAENYLEAAGACLATPPPPDWNGAIELHEK